MRLATELISSFVLLIVAYLVLINYTGFTKDIGSIGQSASGLAKTFQGRA
jgi:hypothetical protein